MNEKYNRICHKSTADKVPRAKGVDIRNDYYPFVDFKFVFPKVSPAKLGISMKAQKYVLVTSVNSGATGEKFRKRREAIRQTWGN